MGCGNTSMRRTHTFTKPITTIQRAQTHMHKWNINCVQTSIYTQHGAFVITRDAFHWNTLVHSRQYSLKYSRKHFHFTLSKHTSSWWKVIECDYYSISYTYDKFFTYSNWIEKIITIETHWNDLNDRKSTYFSVQVHFTFFWVCSESLALRKEFSIVQIARERNQQSN